MRRRLMKNAVILPYLYRPLVTDCGLKANPDYVIQVKADGNTPDMVFGSDFYNRVFRFEGNIYYDLSYPMGERLISDGYPREIYEVECGNNYIKDLVSGEILARGNKITDVDRTVPLRIKGQFKKYGIVTLFKVYYVKVFLNGVCLRDMVPAKNGKDYGWYDKANGKFYKGEGI